eukprot:GEMP01046960.1.p1 GENE.GEMP01046960.1~~GEMP01046960.1.p1  ORF type:complete len:296 (+),score=57.34 GEMP01046960.1:24-890(+)
MVDWPGLLAWSSRYHDGTSEVSNFKALSKEDRDYLQTAMEAMFAQIEDPNTIFKDVVDKIRENPSDEVALTTLEVLDRCCDDPDVSGNIEVLDGLTPMLKLLDSANSNIVARAGEVLGLMLANNPTIQRAAFDKNALDNLLTVPDWTDVVRCRGKVRLLTAIVRNEEYVEAEFVKRGGILFLGECMGCGDEKTVTRAASLLSHLMSVKRAPATPSTALYIARAYTDMRTTSIQSGEILGVCASAHTATKSKQLRDALRPRMKYIYNENDTTSYKQELELILETIRLLE